uniref:ArsB/NhaD family transporter n=1 Tax=Nocardia abscessus TaxID=120957 RepID=UPI002458CE18
FMSLFAGLFLVGPTLPLCRRGFFTQPLSPTTPAMSGASPPAAAGAGLSNIANNLPAYTAGEAVIPAQNGDQLLALLIGTNVGPIVTPWGSLATLLCLEFCRSHDVRVPMTRFVLTGFVLAMIATAGAVAALLVLGQ